MAKAAKMDGEGEGGDADAVEGDLVEFESKVASVQFVASFSLLGFPVD